MKESCPRIGEVSAFMDGALSGPARDEFAGHAKTCPLCGARLLEFTALSERLKTLRDTRCEADLARLVDRRLADRAPARRAPRKRAWWQNWQLAPQGLGVAAALAMGVYLGLLLTGGGAAMRPSAMAVFDASPPGALCAGRCYREGH